MRMSGAAGTPTPEGRCLSCVEGDIEEFLNELALVRPDLAVPWKMTKEFALDNET